MGKNNHGGKKSKKGKNSQPEKNTAVLCVPQENEYLAIVLHMFGNEFDMKNENGETMRCRIGNKFSGKNITQNKIVVNKIVKVEYPDFLRKANLLYVYDDDELSKLVSSNIHFKSIITTLRSFGDKETVNGGLSSFEFDFDHNDDNNIIVQPQPLRTVKRAGGGGGNAAVIVSSVSAEELISFAKTEDDSTAANEINIDDI